MRLKEIAKYILLGIGFVSNVGTILGLWIGYASAPPNVQSHTVRILWTIGLISSALIYLFAGWIVFRLAHKSAPTTPDKSPEQNSALKAAEQRIADLERKLSEMETAKEATLPALRPRIAPVKWGRAADNRCGLFVRNDGEPAFDISVEEPVLIGKAKLQFWDRVHPGLTKADGEMLIEANIELATGYGLTASALRDEMLKADLDVIMLKIRYGDIDGQKWITSCDVVREFWGTGMRISGVRQERAV